MVFTAFAQSGCKLYELFWQISEENIASLKPDQDPQTCSVKNKSINQSIHSIFQPLSSDVVYQKAIQKWKAEAACEIDKK